MVAIKESRARQRERVLQQSPTWVAAATTLGDVTATALRTWAQKHPERISVRTVERLDNGPLPKKAADEPVATKVDPKTIPETAADFGTVMLNRIAEIMKENASLRSENNKLKADLAAAEELLAEERKADEEDGRQRKDGEVQGFLGRLLGTKNEVTA